MDFNEKDFKKMVKKANAKQTGKSVLLTIISLVFIVSLISVPILSYYNYISFGKTSSPKVKGLPNNSIRSLDGMDSYMKLLFMHGGGFEINKKGEEMNIYIDYYEKGERKLHETVYGVLSDGDGGVASMNGTFYWGISEDKKMLRTNFLSTNGAYATGGYNLAELDAVNWSSMVNNDTGKIKKLTQDKFLLVKFVYNEDGRISNFADASEEFSPEVIKEEEKLLQIYAEFK